MDTGRFPGRHVDNAARSDTLQQVTHNPFGLVMSRPGLATDSYGCDSLSAMSPRAERPETGTGPRTGPGGLGAGLGAGPAGDREILRLAVPAFLALVAE